ncbi:FAD assembly factor SdhE [Paracoccus spongiarum]|uniref:FAD assembly factor SdhE n=1 Tax=Paracoccus spongiarum TaxID=3064387 RepID=A0ABT9J8J6_9RHOB|nr:succinate dehydrogenase assembly factor 2 [Paracoccus sp. 2205BS29-5]MDP5306141.1 succinate dehydrogenase assembly factor 2 [Paracoccus sp. 2205BS29-5]
MTETPETRLRRLRMRSWRRGMKEMDLILGPFADEVLPALDDRAIAAYEALLAENDQDLYLWVTRRVTQSDDTATGPAALAAILDRIAAHATARQPGPM